MEYTKTTVDIIKDKNGNQVNFKNVLSDFRNLTTQIQVSQDTITNENTNLTDFQAALATLKSDMVALHAKYPEDVPDEVIEAFNLQTP